MDELMPIDAEQEQSGPSCRGENMSACSFHLCQSKACPTPVNIHLDFDAGTVDEMLDRLTVLRAQMLPKPPAAKKRN